MMRYLLLAALLGACGPIEEDSTPTDCSITLEVTGVRAESYTATWANPGGGVSQEQGIALPWRRTETFKQGEYVSLSGLCFAPSGSECVVTATIRRGSVDLYSATSHGLIGDADVSGHAACE